MSGWHCVTFILFCCSKLKTYKSSISIEALTCANTDERGIVAVLARRNGPCPSKLLCKSTDRDGRSANELTPESGRSEATGLYRWASLSTGRAGYGFRRCAVDSGYMHERAWWLGKSQMTSVTCDGWVQRPQPCDSASHSFTGSSSSSLVVTRYCTCFRETHAAHQRSHTEHASGLVTQCPILNYLVSQKLSSV